MTRRKPPTNPTSRRDLSPDLRALADVLSRRFEREVGELSQEVGLLREEVASLRSRFTELLLTRQEAAERLKCSKRTVKRLEDRGELERVSGVPGVRYHPDEIDKLAEKRNAG